MEREIVAPGIVRYSNIMPTSAKLINIIDDSFTWYRGGAAESRGKKPGYENIRNVKAFVLPDSKNPSDSKELNWWGEFVDKQLGKCQKDYIDYFAIDILQNKNSGYQVLKYEVGDLFSEHTDEIPEEPRRLSGVYYVNDNYLGGEIVFSQFNITIKPKAGDYLLFPSIWSYTHTAMPIVEGVKNAIVHFIY